MRTSSHEDSVIWSVSNLYSWSVVALGIRDQQRPVAPLFRGNSESDSPARFIHLPIFGGLAAVDFPPPRELAHGVHPPIFPGLWISLMVFPKTCGRS